MLVYGVAYSGNWQQLSEYLTIQLGDAGWNPVHATNRVSKVCFSRNILRYPPGELVYHPSAGDGYYKRFNSFLRHFILNALKKLLLKNSIKVLIEYISSMVRPARGRKRNRLLIVVK